MKNSQATFAHTSLVLNRHLPGNPPVFAPAYAQNHISVDRLIVRPQYRDLKDALHLAQGGTAGHVHKGMLAMQLQGRILSPDATQTASLEDMERALRLAFDPYECYRDSPLTDGVYALSWLEPTLDVTNYSTGWMPVTRYVRPTAQPETVWTLTDMPVRQWAVQLVAPDPRLYDTTLGDAIVNGGAWTASVVNHGTIPGPLRVTITMSGAGAATWYIVRAGVADFEMDLSGCTTGDVIHIVMETCGPFGVGRSVKKNGVAAFALKLSSAATWLDVPVGTTVFGISSASGIASIEYEWAHARP